MKPFVKIASVAVMVLLFITTSSFAMLATTQIVLDHVTGAPGDTVSLTLSLESGGADIGGAQFDIHFDNTKLEYLSASAGSAAAAADKDLMTSEPDDQTVRGILFGINSNTIADGTLAIFEFRINNSASEGNSPITLDQITLSDPDAVSVPAVGGNGSVTIEEGHVNPPDPDCNPSTLSESLLLDIPQLVYSTLFGDFGFWVTMDWRDDLPGIVFEVADLEVIDIVAGGCDYAVLNNDLSLSLSEVHFQTLFGDIGLWINLDYMETGDESILFSVSDFDVLD